MMKNSDTPPPWEYPLGQNVRHLHVRHLTVCFLHVNDFFPPLPMFRLRVGRVTPFGAPTTSVSWFEPAGLRLGEGAEWRTRPPEDGMGQRMDYHRRGL
jgi:hypothetical protein